MFFVITFNSKHETIEVYNSRTTKRGSSSQCQAFLQSMTSTLMDFLLEQIYIKKPRSSYATLFLKNIFAPACFPLNNT